MIKSCVIPVGGLGTRMQPATRAISKEMLPIVDKPLLEYAIDEAIDAGIEEIIIIANYDNEFIIEKHLGLSDDIVFENDSYEKYNDRDIFVEVQKKPLGLAHAIWCAKGLLNTNEPFAVILPDDLIYGENCLKKMIQSYKGGMMAAVEEVEKDKVSSYGIVTPGKSKGDEVEILGMVEKPEMKDAPSNLAVVGRYIVTYDIFKTFNFSTSSKKISETQFTKSLEKQMKKHKFTGMKFSGDRYDCGSKMGLAKANFAIGLERNDVIENFDKWAFGHLIKNNSLSINNEILHEYDIRGIYEKTLTLEDAKMIGYAFAAIQIERYANPNVIVGRDGRLSSEPLMNALVEGLSAGGAKVTFSGLGPTPQLYYAEKTQKVGGAIQVTGSHNPPEYNGFKFVMGGKPFFGDDIKQLGERKISNINLNKKPSENVIESIKSDYTKRLLKDAKSENFAVWDCGNGATGDIVKNVIDKLDGNHILLFGDIDGTFPNHHPDPADEKNMEHLRKEVKKLNADIGIAFDGDGDRIGVINSEGNLISGDLLTAYLARDIIKNHDDKGGKDKVKVIFDVKSSRVAIDCVERLGAEVEIWKTGHSNIKQRMMETGAVLAGELSGHIFIADNYFGYDDAIYAAIRILTQMTNNSGPYDDHDDLMDFLNQLQYQYSTPEIRIECSDEEKSILMNKVKELAYAKKQESGYDKELDYRVLDYRINEIDGIRVDSLFGWWLIRPSNTEPVIVLRAEATDPLSFGKITGELMSLFFEAKNAI